MRNIVILKYVKHYKKSLTESLCPNEILKLLIFTLLFHSCIDTPAKYPILESKRINPAESKGYICFDTLKQQVNNMRKAKIIRYNTQNKDPEYIDGIIYTIGNEVNFHINNSCTIFKLFDFGLKENDHKNISTKHFCTIPQKSITKYSNKYQLILENKFHDKTNSDSIYKFKLKGFGVYNPTDDLTCFIGKKAGFTGMYVGTTIFNETQRTELITGIYGNIYKDIIDYSSADFGYQIK